MYFCSDSFVHWLKGNKSIDRSGGKYDMSLRYRLTIKRASVDDEGWYTCAISNNLTTIFQRHF